MDIANRMSRPPVQGSRPRAAPPGQAGPPEAPAVEMPPAMTIEAPPSPLPGLAVLPLLPVSERYAAARSAIRAK